MSLLRYKSMIYAFLTDFNGDTPYCEKIVAINPKQDFQNYIWFKTDVTCYEERVHRGVFFW